MKRVFSEILIFFVAVLIAFGLSLLPLPRFTSPFIPDWVLLVIIYGVIFFPQGIGLGFAWLTGLLTDVLTHSLLGEHALASVLAAYLAIKSHRRFRLFPMWQKMLLIMVFLSLYRSILFWIQGILQQPLNSIYWFSVLTGTLLWPFVAIMLNDFRRRRVQVGTN